jgi:hypothetical protein
MSAEEVSCAAAAAAVGVRVALAAWGGDGTVSAEELGVACLDALPESAAQ